MIQFITLNSAIYDITRTPQFLCVYSGVWYYARGNIFLYNVKTPPFKLVCTIARLFEETPLQPLWLKFYGSTLPEPPAKNFHSSLFEGRKKTKRKGTDPISTL